jgi:hypothetical protein
LEGSSLLNGASMKRILSLAVLSFALTGYGLASEIIVGSKGGFYCTDADDMQKVIIEALQGKMKDVPKSCKMLTPGQKIDVIKKEDISSEVVMGVGKIAEIPTPVIFSLSTSSTINNAPRSSEGREFKRVSPSDVRNTPAKWAGRDIQFSNVQIYWVADDDVRIITNDSVTLFASTIRGLESDISFLRKNCETEKEALSRLCRANVRFSYNEHSTDQPTGIFKRTVLQSNDVELIRIKSR